MLYEVITSLEVFTAMTRYLANLCGRQKTGESLIRFASGIVDEITTKVEKADKPRVYGVFCHPLSPMYATKFGNTLVEMAGGLSLNKQEDFRESSHAEYTAEDINRINPDIILSYNFV